MSGVHGIKAAILSLALLGAYGVAAGNAVPSDPKGNPTQVDVFAEVAGTVITQEEYNAAFNAAARGKFYHGKPPENEIALLQREVGDRLVMRVLLLREAKRRGLRPDETEIQKTLQAYEKRYEKSEQWKKTRAQILPDLTARLEEDSLVAQMEKVARSVDKPDEKAVREYYAAHQDKFTEPEQLRVSVIVLKVAPSSPADAWAKADELAQDIVKRLRGGADFAELARKHSGDVSAQQGGDMGYLHLGMLAQGAQDALGKLKPGEFSEPVQLLEGIVVFRLADRKVSKLNGFEVVQKRAAELLRREQGEQAWNAFIVRLKKETPARMDQSRFLPLSEKPNAGTAPQ